MIHRPLITVYLPTCDRPEKLRRAVFSVINQSYQNWQLIICDDASGEETKCLISDFLRSDERIFHLRNNFRSGACVTRNLGIFGAKGEYITGLDDDDEFSPERLDILFGAYSDKLIFVCDDFYNIYPDSRRIKEYNCARKNFSLRDLLRNNVASNQIFVRTDILRKVGGFNPVVRRLQDWDTWVRICASCPDAVFVRLNACSYSMHHDHAVDAPRVSSSYSTGQAFRDFIKNHQALMDDKTISDLKFYSRYSDGGYDFLDFCKDFLMEPRAKPFIRFGRSFLKKYS